MISKFILCEIFILLLVLRVYSQTVPDSIPRDSLDMQMILEAESEDAEESLSSSAIPPAPDAYALAKYGDIPVSYYTGTPDIHVPIWTVKVGDISVPITLSYHATGIKVDEMASLVGLGWSLNAGGVITRQIREDPDAPNITNNTLSSTRVDNSFEWFSDFEPGTPMYTKNQDYSIYLQDVYGLNNRYDSEPDIFYYNFNGKSGKFYFDNNGNPRIFKHENIKISWTRTGSTTDDVKFTIIDELGNSYEFSDMEFTYIDGMGLKVTAWYLSKMTSPKGDSITFSYQSKTISYFERLPKTAVLNVDSGSGNLSGYSNILTQGRIRTEVKLRKINSSNGASIDFVLDSLNARLDYRSYYPSYPLKEIIVKNSTNIKEHIFKLNTSYFVADEQNYESSLNYRLKLDNVYEYSGDKTTSNLLSRFEYFGDDETESTLRLPYRLSASQDDWGYFNGQSNPSLFPSKNSGVIIYADPVYELREVGGMFSGAIKNGANRTPDSQRKKACMLKKINYPTGGYTAFDYESHNYKGENVAGLRIKKITNFDGTTTSETHYSYEGVCLPSQFDKNSYFSFFPGIGASFPDKNNYRFHLLNDVFNFSLDNNFNIGYYRTNNYIKVSATPQAILDGAESGLGYEKVTERKSGNGYTVYTYASPGGFVSQYNDFRGFEDGIPVSDWFKVQTYHNCALDNCSKVLSTLNYTNKDWPNLPVYSNEWKRSVLKSKKVYPEGGTIPNYSETYEYNMENLGNIAGYHIAKIGNNINEYFIAKYYLPYNWIAPKLKYVTNSGVEILTKYSYGNDNYRLLNRLVNYNSSGDSVEILYKYPIDINTGIYSSMADSNMLNYPIEKTTKVDGNWVGSTLTTYKSEEDNYVPDKVYSLEATSPLPSFTDFTGSVSTKDLAYGNPDIEFLDYDSKGNLLKSKSSNGIYTYYIWAYNKQYPVAKIESNLSTSFSVPVQDSRLSKSDNFPDIQSDVAYLKGLLTNYLSNPNLMVSYYTYKPLVGMTSQTDANGKTTYYEYDDFGRLAFVRDQNGNIVKKHEYHYAGQN